MADIDTVREQMNTWGKAGVPFWFMIDFEMQKPLAARLDETDQAVLRYNIKGITNCEPNGSAFRKASLVPEPESYSEYLSKFSIVKEEIRRGSSYLVNLTCSTPVSLDSSLLDIFHSASAPYRIWYRDEFVCFSPETFVTISNGLIRSFPMKGTIDASLPDAERLILSDPKETAEHHTIVDLIRNDLSMVSERVRVDRFRYTDTIEAGGKKLLQVSSEVCGELVNGSRLGDIIFTLLPAGSVSGAPKKMTTAIISRVEMLPRGYYTGIFGIFDGESLNCCVMIRFIEKRENRYFYRSGGGITAFSDPVSEYNEMIAKIYVPVI